jgi:predicted nucleic acid-binding protein
VHDEHKRAAVTDVMSRAISDRIAVISESKQKEIREVTGVKDDDAFHLAAAVEGRVEYFLTVDDQVLTKADTIGLYYGLKVRNPVDLLLEVAKHGD